MSIPLVLITMLIALCVALLYAAVTVRPQHQDMEGQRLDLMPPADPEHTVLDVALSMDSSTLTWHIHEALELGFWQQARIMQDALPAVLLRERLAYEEKRQLLERVSVRPVVRLITGVNA